MRTRSTLLFVALLSATACGDGKHRRDRDDAGDEIVTGSQGDGGAQLGPDGSTPVDGSTDIDGATDVDGSTDIDGSTNLDGSTQPDGAVDGSTPADGSTARDGSTPADGSTAADGSTPVDGSVIDGGTPADGAVADAQVADGAVNGDAGTGDGGVPCTVTDPKYGCGVASGSDWISFPDFEVDLKNNTAWTVPVPVADDDALFNLCPTLTNGGLTWDMPQTADVRQLAAGCAKTVTGGSCQVYLNEVLTSEAGDCICDASLVGPHNGKFCRPEVPECATLWVWTHTWETGFYQHWFYDVNTGSITPAEVAVGIANTAVGRCVHHLSADELPTVTLP